MTTNEFKIKGGLDAAKQAVNAALQGMGFTVQHTSAEQAVAERGSQSASAVLGPLAGKKGAYMKLGLSYAPSGDTTTLFLTEATHGAMKALTLTGGTTKRAFQETLEGLRTALSTAGVLA
jgi:hypothetical protein